MKSMQAMLTLVRPALQEIARTGRRDTEPDLPACIMFFCVSDGTRRAEVRTVTGADFGDCWTSGVTWLSQWQKRSDTPACWLRVEYVSEILPLTWAELKRQFAQTKRNYFRFGLAFDRTFKRALLEQELAANAILYNGSLPVCTPNQVNLTHYARARFQRDVRWPDDDASVVWRFKTQAVFADDTGVHPIETQGRNSGYRRIDAWGPACVRQVIEDSAAYLARQVRDNGRYDYGWFPCFDRPIPTYNALRHASSTYALLEAWEVTRQPDQEQAIRKALTYLETTLIRKVDLPGEGTLAFLVDEGAEIKLGGNAVCLLAFSKYTELTGDTGYLPLMERLAAGILHMQDAQSGAFVHVLNYPDLSVKQRHRIIYYDGEAAFGLMRLYGLHRDARWLRAVEKAFDHFIAARHWQAHDHWLSYCVNELTRYRPDPRYFQFGLDNVRDYLDFVRDRITTFPTLLELMMAAWQMITRMQQEPQTRSLLDGFPLDKFHEALETRARYLLSGFFWPEFAMFFKNPRRILHGFYIRHHSFRVRIDDVEHYLSGYVTYLSYLGQADKQRDTSVKVSGLVPAPAWADNPVIAWAGDVNLGRRQHYRTAQLGVENVLDVPALREVDLAIVNLECVVATSGEQGVDKGEGGPYYYRARPEMLRVLTHAGIRVVVTANNHAGDYGPQALMEQARLLNLAGIDQVGSGMDREQAFTPLLRDVKGVRVALFAVDFTQRRFAASSSTAGTAYLDPRDPAFIVKEMSLRITAVRELADVVLVAAHYGVNQAETPSPQDVAVARALIDAGADAVLGASAHELQGIEIYQGRPIIHDAGDLLFDAIQRGSEPSGVFHLGLSRDGVTCLVFVPVAKCFGHSVQRHGPEALDAARWYAERCRCLGTEMSVADNGRAFIRLRPPARPEPIVRRRNLLKTRLRFPGQRVPSNPGWRVSEVPEDARLPPTRLGPLILLGVRVWPRTLAVRQMLWVESFWCAPEPVKEDVRLDFRAVPQRQTRMKPWGLAMDHDPCDWMMPTSRWQSGIIYRDFYGLRPPTLDTWDNVPLQLQVGLVSKEYEVPKLTLPHTVTLAIPGLDRPQCLDNDFAYRTAFALEARACAPGQTWTAHQLSQVARGEWLVPPPEGWHVRSVVAGETHIEMVPPPTLFVGHDSLDRCRHESSQPPAKNFDRHRVIEKRAADLAGAIVTDRSIVGRLPSGFPVLLVEDPIRTLIELGLAARQRYQGEVIAITGTAGKSTTVGMLQQMLGGPERVLASFGNYNSRVGAPTLLANLHPDHTAVVVEVAQSALWMTRGPVTRLLKPTVALITEIGLSQTDARVKSIADTAKWKSRIFDGLTGGAVAVIGEHLPCLDYVLDMARKHARKVVMYGRSPAATVRLEAIESEVSGSRLRVRVGQRALTVHVPVPGGGMVNNALAALSVAYVVGHDLETVAARLGAYRAGEGRMVRKSLVLGGISVDIIDDSFNATVLSFVNALSVLKDTVPGPHGRKIAVLGRMVHLGPLAKSLHESLASPLLDCGVAQVVTHGEEMCFLRAVLPPELLGPHFSDVRTLVAYLRETLADGDLVLFKGSRRESDFGRVCDLLQAGCAPASSGSASAVAQSVNQAILADIMARKANSYSDSPYHARTGDLARHLISDVAHAMGYTVTTERGRVFRVSKQGIWSIFTQNTPDASVTCLVTRNKHLTKQVLAQAGVPVPKGKVFRSLSEASAYFRQRQCAQVVKPLNGEGGKGVTTGITTEPDLIRAWEAASKFGGRILVEDYVTGEEVRFITLGGEVLAAVCRVPAHVTGDGKRTIGELVALKNRLRQANPLMKLYPIRPDAQLARDGRRLEDIPRPGEQVRLASVSNVALGGESVGVLSVLHPSLIEMAHKTASAIPGATLLGLDVIVRDFRAPASPENFLVLEVNSNPAIATPYFSAYGEPATRLPHQLMAFVERRRHETQLPVQASAVPSLQPAAVYHAWCGGDSFRRDYSTQMRLLRQAAYRRNIEVQVIGTDLTRLTWGSEQATFFQGMCSRTRLVARRASNDKSWTRRLLDSAGIPIPRGNAFDRDAVEPAWAWARSLDAPVVVKPASGSGGTGISTQIRTRDHFDLAWRLASTTGNKTILVEEHVKGRDYRVVVIGAAICAVTERIPAHVVGDGRHSIAQLVALKNQARRANPFNGAKLMTLTPMMRRNLAQLNLDADSVLEAGRTLQLHTVANIGSGGDSRDVTDLVHPDWAPIAARVRETLYDPVHVGFDLIAQDIARPPNVQRWWVIEVNTNPDFGLQHFPSEGTPRDLAGALLEYVFPGCGKQSAMLTQRVNITGQFCTDAYLRWLWGQAHLHGVHGFARRGNDGEIDAVLQGPSRAVEQLLRRLKTSFPGGSVGSVKVADHEATIAPGFSIEKAQTGAPIRARAI